MVTIVRVLVLSDSHGFLSHMQNAVEKEHPDCVIHLGDHIRDADELQAEFPKIPVMQVKGNCDFCDFITPECRIDTFHNVRVMAMHGHTHGVKSNLLRLLLAAKENAVHVALFGHTHCPYCEYADDIWLVNPGSCGAKSSGSYAMIEIVGDKCTCYLKSI